MDKKKINKLEFLKTIIIYLILNIDLFVETDLFNLTYGINSSEGIKREGSDL